MAIKTAAIIGFALVAVIIGIDVYLAIDSIRGNTWSEMLRSFSFKSPLAPWVWGGLGGHFFHEWIPKLPLDGLSNISLLVWLSVVVLIIGHALASKGLYLPPVIVFFVGFFVWSSLWPV